MVFYPGNILSLILFLTRLGRSPARLAVTIKLRTVCQHYQKLSRNVQHAKNYPLVLADSNFMGPVTVGNIREYNGRRIVETKVDKVEYTFLNSMTNKFLPSRLHKISDCPILCLDFPSRIVNLSSNEISVGSKPKSFRKGRSILLLISSSFIQVELVEIMTSIDLY